MPTTTQIETTLNINAIGERTDFDGVAVNDLSAEEIRFDQEQYSEGVLKPVEAFEVNKGGGGTMNVIVGSGSAKTDYMIVDGDTTGQGSYLVRLDEVSKSITLSAADPSNSRTDEIWLVVLDDAYDTSARALPILAVREGDAGAGAPGPDAAWTAAVKLASVTVPAGIGDITEAAINDSRPFTDLAFASGGAMPVGGGFLWFASVAPEGHVLARGQLLNPDTYPRLFQIWGTTYGGDGSSTFGVPDLRQRLPLGRASSGTGSVLGDTGGTIDHTHATSPHTHTNPNVNSAGSHAHSQGNTGSGGGGSTGSAGGHSHSLTSGFAKIALTGDEIKMDRASVSNWTFNVKSNNVGTTFINTQTNHAVRLMGTSGSVGNHNHSLSNHAHTNPNTNSNGSHTHSQGNTGEAGDDATGAANPPYLVVEYAIRAA